MRVYFYLPEHHDDGEYVTELDMDCLFRSGDHVYIDKMYYVEAAHVSIATHSKSGVPYGGQSYFQNVYLVSQLAEKGGSNELR